MPPRWQAFCKLRFQNSNGSRRMPDRAGLTGEDGTGEARKFRKKRGSNMAMLTSTKSEIFRTLFTVQPYKAGHGSKARRGTLAALGILIVTGMYSWSQVQAEQVAMIKWGLPLIFGALAGWVSYRLVHYPRFADFLIATEAEMAKVSWPGTGELKASTVVVLLMVVLMAVFLFLTDTFWKWLLKSIGILKIGGLIGGGGAGMSFIPPLPSLVEFIRSLLV